MQFEERIDGALISRPLLCCGQGLLAAPLLIELRLPAPRLDHFGEAFCRRSHPGLWSAQRAIIKFLEACNRLCRRRRRRKAPACYSYFLKLAVRASGTRLERFMFTYAYGNTHYIVMYTYMHVVYHFILYYYTATCIVYFVL